MLRTAMICVMILTSCGAGFMWAAPKEIKHFELKINPDDAEPVDYYIAMPNKYDPAERYPLLYCVPGSGMNNGEVDKNQAINYVQSFSEKYPDFIVYSIWFTDKNQTYPHWSKPRAVDAAKLITRHILDNYSVDLDRVFMEFFSGGGAAAADYPFQAYAKDAPFKIAGLLFTSANFRGGNPGADCISPDTYVFVEVGELETTAKGFVCDLQAEGKGWENLFKNKVGYSEYNIIPGQEHVISEAAHVKIKIFMDKTLADANERKVKKTIKNLAMAEKLLKSKQYAKVLDLLGSAMGADSEDELFVKGLAVAKAIDSVLVKLKAAYRDKLETDPEAAYAALFAIETIFKGSNTSKWAYGLIMEANRNPVTAKILGKAKKASKALVDAESGALGALQ